MLVSAACAIDKSTCLLWHLHFEILSASFAEKDLKTRLLCHLGSMLAAWTDDAIATTTSTPATVVTVRMKVDTRIDLRPKDIRFERIFLCIKVLTLHRTFLKDTVTQKNKAS